MIVIPIPGNEPSWSWVLGLAIGVVVFCLLIPFLDRYLGPIMDRYMNWADRKLKKKG